MKMHASDPHFLLTVLHEVDDKLTKLSNAGAMCELAETVAALTEALELGVAENEKQPESAEAIGIDDARIKEDLPTEENDNTTPSDVEPVQGRLRVACEQILDSIARQACGKVEDLRPQEIRRLLCVYSLLPFKADEFFDAIDNRLANFTVPKGGQNVSVDKLIQTAREKCGALRQTLFEETQTSRLEAFKSRILSLLGANHESDEGRTLYRQNSQQ